MHLQAVIMLITGFICLAQRFFYDYYLSNGFEIIKSYIFEYERQHDKAPWLIYEYVPDRIQHLSFGGWGGVNFWEYGS